MLDNVILKLEEWISFNSKIDVGCDTTNKLITDYNYEGNTLILYSLDFTSISMENLNIYLLNLVANLFNTIILGNMLQFFFNSVFKFYRKK